MKFSTKTLAKVTAMLVADFEEQLQAQSITAEAIEQGMREALREIGRESVGQMLSVKDEQSCGVNSECSCGEQARRISRREAQLLSVFGWTRYRRSYYACEHCQRRWYALDEQEGLRAGRASCGMKR